MPSPACPTSTSDPFLVSASSSKIPPPPPPSNRFTSSSSRSGKSVYWLSWSNAAKLGTIISLGRTGSNSSKHSDLTQESLEAHNQRLQEAYNYENVDDKNSKCSPYYKGLTDYTLTINREKHHYLPNQLPSSPERENHAPTNATSVSSISSLALVKVQDWISCLSFKSVYEDKQNNPPAPVKFPVPVSAPVTPPVSALPPPPPPLSHDSPIPVPYFTPPAPSGVNITSPFEQERPSFSNTNSFLSFEPSTETIPKKNEETDEDVLPVANYAKPLRERVSTSVSKSPAPLPLSPIFPAGETTSTNVDVKIEPVIDVSNRKNFTWADKYRPKKLTDFICNRTTAANVKGLIKGIDSNHFIFQGPGGVGKRTMILAMIQEAYELEELETREESKAFNLKGESIRKIDVKIKSSSRHVEVNLSDLKGYEKHVIVELIKETNDKKSKKDDTCRAIILYNADKLSGDAVLYIKWLLLRYKGSNTFFFCCSEINKLQSIKELCTIIQLLPPSTEEIVEILEFIAKKEGIELPCQFAQRIAQASKSNLRQAIRSLEASWQKSYPFTEDQEILTGWEDDIADIANDMVQEQSPKQLYFIRGKLQNLIDHDTILAELKKLLDERCHDQLDNLYKDYTKKEGNMLEGGNQSQFPKSRSEKAGKRLQDPARKKDMQIEGFIAKFMSMYKSQDTHQQKHVTCSIIKEYI